MAPPTQLRPATNTQGSLWQGGGCRPALGAHVHPYAACLQTSCPRALGRVRRASARRPLPPRAASRHQRMAPAPPAPAACPSSHRPPVDAPGVAGAARRCASSTWRRTCWRARCSRPRPRPARPALLARALDVRRVRVFLPHVQARSSLPGGAAQWCAGNCLPCHARRAMRAPQCSDPLATIVTWVSPWLLPSPCHTILHPATDPNATAQARASLLANAAKGLPDE